MSLALLEEAADSVGGGVLFVTEGARVAEFVAAARGLLLLLDVEDATRLGEGDGGAIRPMLHCHELVLLAEKLVFELAPTLHFPFSFTSKMKQMRLVDPIDCKNTSLV
jgi:hypothetical protein